MLPEDLYKSYPILFHMAWKGSWDNIRSRGLWSTSRLLDLYSVEDHHRQQLEKFHRPECVTISSDSYPDAVIRDQKPMSDAGVRRALGRGIDPSRWYKLLNSMVFFWPTVERLKVMLGADAYANLHHDVLVVDTRGIITDHKDRLRLSHMNSGSTRRFPHPRSLDLFKSLADYPFSERVRKYGVSKAVAEVCFIDGIANISDYVKDVKTVCRADADQVFAEYERA